MIGQIGIDRHIYIDRDQDGLEGLLDWLSYFGRKPTLRVDTRQATPGTIHCDEPRGLVTMHPSDHMWLLRGFSPSMGDPLGWFERDRP